MKPNVRVVSSFHEQLAPVLIEQLRRGEAPWQRAIAKGSALPFNPIKGKRYHGANLINLLAQERSDPRWLTAPQALRLGARVRPAESGVLVQCWQFRTTQATASGTVDVALSRPRLATAVVFNAEQLDDFPPFVPSRSAEDGLARSEALLRSTGARVLETDARLYYEPSTDTLHLPRSRAGRDDHTYYASVLNELARWTGHATRLDRRVDEPIGSMADAAEQLRAAIYAHVTAHELGLVLPRNPRAYLVDAWVRLLEADPLAIGRAAAEAERIHAFVLEHSRGARRAVDPVRTTDHTRAPARGADPMAKKHYLAVPYHERQLARAGGAAWDPAAKCWFAGPNANLEALARWEPTQLTERTPPGDTREQFADALRRAGFHVTGAHPIMDGRKHRISTDGDKRGEKAGYYVAHLDGVPSGFALNYRSGEQTRWRASGYACSPEELAQFRARAAEAARQRAEERARLEREAAARLAKRVSNLVPPRLPTPYMLAKGIAPIPGLLTDAEGRTTYVPAYDTRGALWTMQYIAADGTKRFARNSRKEGCFHPLGGHSRLREAAAIVIAEGISTAASIDEALGRAAVATIAAFDAHNVVTVAKALRAAFPAKPIVIAGDDDRALEREKGLNPGRHRAHEAAAAVRGHAVLPTFAPQDDSRLTDFNDLAQKSALGAAAVARQLTPVLARACEQMRHHQQELMRARTNAARSQARSVSHH